MGFLGARYEAARHIVPDRASHAPLAPLSISICPILFLSDRLAIFGIMCLSSGRCRPCQNLRDHVLIVHAGTRPLTSAYINRSKNV